MQGTEAKFSRMLGAALAVLLAWPVVARPQTWTPLNHQPTVGLDTALLLTDGTVMAHEYGAAQWWKLTPDSTGSYQNGTWTQLASLPTGYEPLYFGSAVLPDGRVLVEGGEYNDFSPDWTTKGAIYNPATNTWTSVNPPSGWTTIGDAQTVILINGTLMQANCCTTQAAYFNEKTLAWTEVGTGKADINDEEGWTLLPNGTVLTVDANNTSDDTNSEIYTPSTETWATAGSTIVELDDLNTETNSHELGPAVLQPTGIVLATGATGNNALYNTATKTWTAGPAFEKVNGQQLDIADGPAALLPDGNVLVDTSPGIYETGTSFFEWNGTAFNSVPGPPNAAKDSSYYGRMLELPTGQIFFTDGSSEVELYTPSGSANSAWAPAITTVPTTLTPGKTYEIQGTQLNGLSQGGAYGDDAQMATNYPLVRITNTGTGAVVYAKTHNFSTMAVATGTRKVTAQFDVPATIGAGRSTLQVVTNGIVSAPVNVDVN
jgi:Kelch motif